jgi:large subunit ribosomal protein L19
MNADLQNKIEKKFVRKVPEFHTGDTIAVTTAIREGDKQRTQTFKGIVLMTKGDGIRKTFTVRKISDGIGVEKILPLYSPNILKVVVLKRGDVRRSKLYYMRGRTGKRALKVMEKEGKYDEMLDDVTEEGLENSEDVVEELVVGEETAEASDESKK